MGAAQLTLRAGHQPERLLAADGDNARAAFYLLNPVLAGAAQGAQLGQQWAQDMQCGHYGSIAGDLLFQAGVAGAGVAGGELSMAAVASDAGDVVSLNHGSINDATSIRTTGLDPNRGVTFVSTDINAARDAVGPNRYDVAQGLARDPGIVESRIPRGDFERVISAPRPYGGLFGSNLNSTEIRL